MNRRIVFWRFQRQLHNETKAIDNVLSHIFSSTKVRSTLTEYNYYLYMVRDRAVSYCMRSHCIWSSPNNIKLPAHCTVSVGLHVHWVSKKDPDIVDCNFKKDKPVGDRFARSYLYATSMFLCLNWILRKQIFGREIIFEEFQPMWSRYLIVTDGRHAIS